MMRPKKKQGHPDMIACDVYALRWQTAGLTRTAAAALCGVHPRTVKRWEVAGACPRWFIVLCQALGGQLSALSGGCSAWDGWRLVDGMLYSPEGVSYSPYEINSMPWLWAMVSELQTKQRAQNAPGVQQVLPFPMLSQKLV